ncbi:MAG: T9SS type A sorting domain-containing protein [Bacteroidales bacterium]|nr:T9SS type A sorting domain-containing protein [Bacteroidales bacterium]
MKKSIYLFLLLLVSFQLSAQEKNTTEDLKYVLIEELTGTWCSYCPSGIVEGRQLSHDYENVIFVAIHTNDPMAYSNYADATGLTGAPTGNVNRKQMGQSPQAWESLVIQETAITPPAYITVETNYNESTRELEAIVTAEFTESVNGNLRLAGLVLEDAVTGQDGYDQSNHYSGENISMGGFEDLPSPVPSSMIAYDHVARQLLGGYDGVEGSIPASVSAGETHSYTFNYTLAEGFDPEYIRVAGWLINNDNGEILNAGKSHYLPGHDNGKPHFITSPITSGFAGIAYTYQLFTADPNDNNITISAVDLPDWLTLEQTTQSTVHTEGILSGTPTAAGSYPITLSVSDEEWTVEQTFILVVTGNPGAGWEVIGEEGFSTIETTKNVMQIATDGTPFLAFNKYGSPISVLKFMGDNWEDIGSSPGIADSHFDMVLNNEGNPCIALNDPNQGARCIVKEFDGSNWVNVGEPISTGGARNIDLAIDSEGVLYTVFFEQSMNTAGFVYKYVNDAWEMVGDGQIDPGAALFFELDFDNNDTPYLLWCNDGGGYHSRVSKFENGTWNVLGGGNISTNATYFYNHIAISDDNQIYVSISESTSTATLLNVYHLNNDNWENITSTENLAGESHDLIADADNHVILGFRNSNQGSQTSVIKYDGMSWESMGPVIISGAANYHSMDISPNNEPYIAYSDANANEKATVKAYLSSDIAIININPGSITFPDTFINHSAEETITISNSGNIALEVNSISSDNEIFTVDLNDFTLEAGESQELIITFNPLLVQAYSGNITIESNDSQQESTVVEVSGNGILNTGVLEHASSSYTIYPQPANDFISIVSKNNINTITIYNLNGQEVLRRNCGSTKKQINISELDAGIYMIRIEINSETFFEKLIIQ